MNVVTKLPPLSELGFGLYFAPEMALSKYERGQWSPVEIVPLQNLSLHPAAKVLHYAQEIFEGLKAFKRSENGKVETTLFRPQDNIRRMSKSAELMAMPPFPEEKFLKCLIELVGRSPQLIPENPGALYLRPTMVGTSTQLGVAPAQEYLFYVLASPVGGYFGSVQGDQPAQINVWVSETHVRAAPGGVGAAKTGANYAASLRPVAEAKKRGFSNVLFLDAIHHRNLEELSGMNVFAVLGGQLKTPLLGDTILDGVTRKSLIQIAQSLGISCSEENISIEELIAQSNQASCELFACGTGASVTSIGELGFKEKIHKIGTGKPGPITTKLYQALLQIQTGQKSKILESSQWAEALTTNWCVKC
jgi:branched-chain amino acid aminotransferase